MAQVQVTLDDTVYGRHLRLRLPDDVPLAKLVPALARKLGLPEGEYVLTIEGTDAPLPVEATLAGAGVAEGATLRLEHAVPEVSPFEAELSLPAESAPTPPTSAPPVAPAARRIGLPKWTWVVGGVVLAAALVSAWLLVGRSDPKLHTWRMSNQTWGYGVNVAFSPDGRLLATGLFGLTLWDVETGQPLRSMKVGDCCVNNLAFSPDGRIVAAGGCNSDVSLYEVKTGLLLRTLVWDGYRPSRGEYQSTDRYAYAAFSPDGAIIALAVQDGNVILWDAQTGQQLRSLVEMDLEWITAGYTMPAAFSPDGKLFVSNSATERGDAITTVLRIVETGQELHVLGFGVNHLQDVAFSPDGRMLATAREVEVVDLWDVQTGDRLHGLDGGPERAFSVAFSPDGATLASGWTDGAVVLWDVQTGRKLRSLRGHEATVHSLDFGPNGTDLASGSSDGTAILWEVGR